MKNLFKFSNKLFNPFMLKFTVRNAFNRCQIGNWQDIKTKNLKM